MAIDDFTGAPPDGSGAAHGGGTRPGMPVDPFRLQRALLRGKWWLIGVGVGGVIIGFLWAKLMLHSSYETTTVLKFEGFDRIAGLPTSRNELGPAADTVMHQSVLRKIAEEVEFEGKLSALKRTIGYQINHMGRTMHITVSGGATGEDAAEYARTVADVFMAYHKESQAKRIELEIASTQKRIEAAEDESEAARRVYNDFRDEHGIADLTTEQRSMLDSAATLRADSELAASEIRALEAQVTSLETQLADTPKTQLVLGGSSPERAAYNRLREELATARATLSQDHPRVLSLQQQVNGMRAQIRSGGATSGGGDGQLAVNTTHQAIQEQLRVAKSDLEALRERQKGLAEMATKAQERVEVFSDIEGEAFALLAEVKVSENLTEGLRKTEAALEDALRDPSSGFVVLDPGAVPEYPVRNKMKLVVFVLVPTFSFGLTLLLVLWWEFRGLRVQTPAEVAYWGKGPVLAATAWPNDPRGLEDLVVGLDDYAPEAKGNILIVGGSPHESGLTDELANRMNNDWFLTDAQPPGGVGHRSDEYQRAPLQTPPPSGPYPLDRSGSHSTALARRPSVEPMTSLSLRPSLDQVKLQAWDGPFEGQALRRAARLADRVVVLVHSGALSVLQLNGTHRRVGRERGVAYIVVGLSDELQSLPDRAGNVAHFWRVST